MAVLLSNHTPLDLRPGAVVLEIAATTAKNQAVWSSTRHGDHEGPPASFGVEVGISVMIGVLWIWSGFGNLLTILAITKFRHMKTKSNFFILSLAFSDLFSGVIASPLWLYRRIWGFDKWLWGDFLCKVFWFVDESTSYCTAMHIASFAVWRYIGVRCPHEVDTFTKWSIKIWISSMWAVALVFGGCIFSTFYAVRDGHHHDHLGEDYAQWPSCSVKIPDNGVRKHLIYYTFSSTTFMIVPMFILCVSSFLIARELFCHRKLKSIFRKNKEKKAVCQLALISASFLFGYVPMTTYVMWTTRSPHSDEKLDYWMHVASYFTLRISECLNPIIYNIASMRMRNASEDIIRAIRNVCRDAFRTDREIELAMRNPPDKKKRKARAKSPRMYPSSSSGQRTPGYVFPPTAPHKTTCLLERAPDHTDAAKLPSIKKTQNGQPGGDDVKKRTICTLLKSKNRSKMYSRKDGHEMTSL